jgi:hypothetical protein
MHDHQSFSVARSNNFLTHCKIVALDSLAIWAAMAVGLSSCSMEKSNGKNNRLHLYLCTYLLFASKFGRSHSTDQTCGPHRSDRCGQSPRNPIWISPLDRSHRVDQNPYVELPNRSPDEGDMTSPRSTRRVHQSDRCPSPVRPVPPQFRAKLRSPDRLVS